MMYQGRSTPRGEKVHLMNAAVAAKKTTAPRARAIPFHEYLSLRMAESGKTNVEIAEALGYPRPNVVAMLKTGAMKLPLNKIGPMARILGVDPVALLERHLTETAPEVWDVLQSVLGNRLISDNQMALVEFVSKHLDGFDANVIGYKEFTDAITPPLKMIAKREKELASAALAAMRRK